MDIRPSVEAAAKEILRIVVRDLHLKADAMINAQPVMQAFSNLPWKLTDLRPGLVYAQEKGWITHDGRLTAAGFAAAPVF